MKSLNRSFVAFLLPIVLPGGLQFATFAQAPNLEAYRKFALTHEGDTVRGGKLFNDEQKIICAKCHSVDGSASKSGPDLIAAGDAFGRRDLVDAVLRPSATIAPGYGTVIVETKAGDAFQGVLKRATDAAREQSGNARRHLSAREAGWHAAIFYYEVSTPTLQGRDRTRLVSSSARRQQRFPCASPERNDLEG